MIRLLIFTITLSLFSKVSAQETVSVSKEELLQKVTEKNFQVKLANQEVAVAKAELLQTRAMYLPNVNASYTAITTNNPLMAFGSRLNQERITMQDFDPAKLNNPENISNFATKLEVQQPIYNQDMVYQKKLDK
jgi:outer membrane protein TolC